jgi:hypothetical protein
LQQLDGAIRFTAPSVNLGEAFEDQRPVINILRYWHQIHGVLCLTDGQFFMAKSSVDLSEDSNGPRVLRLYGQSLLQDRASYGKSSDCPGGITLCPRDDRSNQALGK